VSHIFLIVHVGGIIDGFGLRSGRISVLNVRYQENIGCRNQMLDFRFRGHLLNFKRHGE